MKIFEIKEKSGKIVYLSDERWKHIVVEHTEATSFLEELKATLINPTRITTFNDDESIHYYYKYFKHLKQPTKYFLVIVKYLNGNGFVITAYFVKSIK